MKHLLSSNLIINIYSIECRVLSRHQQLKALMKNQRKKQNLRKEKAVMENQLLQRYISNPLNLQSK